MATDFNKPVVTDAYATLLPGLVTANKDLAMMLEPTLTGTSTNLPTGAVRWNATTIRWERYNGTAWVTLPAAGNNVYAISISGNADTATAATTAAACSGNALTATTATKLAAGAAGQIPYQTGAGATGFSAAGTAGQVLTSGGAGAPTWTSVQAFPAGTRVPFAQASAPTGWTQDTSDAANNRMLRVVNSAGNGVGGSHSPVLNNVVPSHTHGFTTGSVSADHTHSDYGHSHSYSRPSSTLTYQSGGNNQVALNTITATQTATAYASLTGINANHTHSGSTDNGSSQTDWQPRYIDLIICSKN